MQPAIVGSLPSGDRECYFLRHALRVCVLMRAFDHPLRFCACAPCISVESGWAAQPLLRPATPAPRGGSLCAWIAPACLLLWPLVGASLGLAGIDLGQRFGRDKVSAGHLCSTAPCTPTPHWPRGTPCARTFSAFTVFLPLTNTKRRRNAVDKYHSRDGDSLL